MRVYVYYVCGKIDDWDSFVYLLFHFRCDIMRREWPNDTKCTLNENVFAIICVSFDAISITTCERYEENRVSFGDCLECVFSHPFITFRMPKIYKFQKDFT